MVKEKNAGVLVRTPVAIGKNSVGLQCVTKVITPPSSRNTMEAGVMTFAAICTYSTRFSVDKKKEHQWENYFESFQIDTDFNWLLVLHIYYQYKSNRPDDRFLLAINVNLLFPPLGRVLSC